MKSKKSFSRTLAFVFFVLLIISIVISKTLFDAGELGPVFNNPLSSCLIHRNVVGAEDLITVDEGRTVLISAVDRGDVSSVKRIPGIYRYSGDAEPQLLHATDGEPHGITAFPTEGGSRVYVVVHKPKENDRVEIYDWRTLEGTLTLAKSIPFPVSYTLNGIAAMSGDRFFVSQDMKFSPGPLQEIERILRLPLGRIWYYDGKQADAKVVREEILYPNGLAISPDEKYLYVASMTGRSLITYDLTFGETLDASLKWQREWRLKTAPDNLKWDGNDLLSGSHRQLITLLFHTLDPKKHRAPSQLIRISGLPGAAEIEELHSTKSGGLEGISTGVRLETNDHIVMGGIYSEGVLDCAAR